MTSLLQAFSGHASNFCQARDIAPGRSATAPQNADLEYQAVYATLVMLLAGGAAVVLTGLAHAF